MAGGRPLRPGAARAVLHGEAGQPGHARRRVHAARVRAADVYYGRILAKTVFLWAHFSENCLFMGAFYRKLLFYWRILAKTVFLGRQKLEISLKYPAKVRSFANYPAILAKCRKFAGHLSEISHFCRPKKDSFR